MFSAEEQGIVEDILVVLKPLKKATVFVSGEKQPSASKILPTLAKLRMEMSVNENLDSPLAAEMKRRVIDNLNKRYTDQAVTNFLLKASFLDPRYKSLHNVAKEGAVHVTKQALRDMCIKVADHKFVVKAESITPSFSSPPDPAVVKEEAHFTDSDCTEPPEKKSKQEPNDYDDWLNDVIFVKTENTDSQLSNTEKINKELEKYVVEQQIKGDPLMWWKGRESCMPTLAKVARAILCVPSSSVPSERVFSKCGQLVNKRRASLKSKNVNMIVFLNKNYSYKYKLN